MISFPWDNTSSTNLDRNVSSDTLAEKYFHEIAGQNSGIYAPVGSMGSVSAGTGMTVIVQPVNGIIVGRIYNEVDARTLTIQASEALDRIDTVVIRRDMSARGVDLYIVKGIAASSPVRPALTRSGDIYEVGIADLFISANTTSITNERITDTRSESARCQIVPVVGSIDTTSMFNQFQAALDAYLDIVAAAIDETLAGNLQNQIDAIEAILDKYSLNTAPAYSASNTYALGAYVMYNNDLYRCTTAITVAEAWTAGHWTKTSVGAELNTINTNLNWYITNGVLPPLGTYYVNGIQSIIASVASSYYNATYAKEKSYDNSLTTAWLSSEVNPNIVYTFANPVKVQYAEIITSNGSGNIVGGTVSYFGSNDGVNFVAISDIFSQTFNRVGQSSVFVKNYFSSSNFYKYIKVVLYCSSGTVGIDEIRFTGDAKITP